jgi:hypothetical protein
VKHYRKHLIDFVNGSRFQAELKGFEHGYQLLSIDQFDWACAIPHRFLAGIHREGGCCQEDALVGAADHGTSKIPNHGGTD